MRLQDIASNAMIAGLEPLQVEPAPSASYVVYYLNYLNLSCDNDVEFTFNWCDLKAKSAL